MSENGDQVEQHVGQWGRYQALVVVLLVLPGVLAGAQILSLTFTAAVPKHRCYIPAIDGNDSVPQFSKAFIGNKAQLYLGGPTKEGGKDAYCHYCPHAPSHLLGKNASLLNGTELCALRKDSKECDHGHVYDYSQYKSSIAMKFDGVCRHGAYKRDLVKTCFMLGKLVGAFACGLVSDKIGRKPVLLMCALLGLVTCNVVTVLPYFWLVCICVMLNGAFLYGMFLTVFVLCMEVLGGIYRTVVGIWVQGFFAMGYLYLGLLAYLMRHWEHVQMGVSLPLILVVPYYWLIPESIRWQIVNGRAASAKKTILKITKFNKRHVDEDQLDRDIASMTTEHSESASIIDLFRHKVTAVVTLIVFFTWFGVGMSYYGISYNTDDLPGNDYVNFALMGISEIPAYILCIILMEKLGRRPTVVSFMLLAGIACIAVGFIPSAFHTAIITLAFIGKMCSSGAFALIYNYSAEVFPTVVRHAATGASSTIARCGSGLAPQIHSLEKFTAHWVPFFIYGVVSCLAGIADIFLPETRNQAMPETIEDSVNVLSRKRKKRPSLEYIPSPVTAPEAKTLL